MSGLILLIVLAGVAVCPFVILGCSTWRKRKDKNDLERGEASVEEIEEKEKLNNEDEEVRNEDDTFKVENERLTKENDTFKVENERLTKENERLTKENEMLKKKQCDIEAWIQAHEHADNITLDVDSAHPYITIAPDKRSFTHETEIRQLSPNPQRFGGIVAVLGCEAFSSGNHYWEVDIGSSSNWDVGVAMKSVNRNGNIILSPKEGFWLLGFTGQDYFAKTFPWTKITVQRKLRKLGVYLSLQEKKVTFFNVNNVSVLFEFKACEFSGDIIHPFFKNGDKGKTMFIHTIK